MRTGLEEASAELRSGGSRREAIRQLGMDTSDPLAMALASLGRGMLAKET
jgi:hypothetical protein